MWIVGSPLSIQTSGLMAGMKARSPPGSRVVIVPQWGSAVCVIRLLAALPLIVHTDGAPDVVRAAARSDARAPRRRSYQGVESSPACSAFSASASAQLMRSISWDEKWGLSTSDALTRSFS
jgi:hypothetical protein